MSQQDVEVVRAAFEAWNAGDMDAARELHDPDVTLLMPEGWPEPGPFAGRDEVMRQWEQMRDTWDADDFELISDFIDAGDRVAVRFIWRGAGYGPGANIEATGVFTRTQGQDLRHEALLEARRGARGLGSVRARCSHRLLLNTPVCPLPHCAKRDSSTGIELLRDVTER
jgi:ketosteroid isomerase-like protein